MHVSLTTPAGEERTLVVRGIYDPPQAKQLLGPISMTQQGFDEAFTQPKNSYTFIDADASAAAPLKAAAKGLGDANYHVGAEYPKDATKEMATMLAMLYVLLGFSVIVSLFGMVNTMVLSVFERTREIGMLRTIGMTRRQARRMIRHESVITALIGADDGPGPRPVPRRGWSPRRCRTTSSRSRSPCRCWPRSRWSPSSRASARRSCRHGGPRGSTCSTPCTTSRR